MVKKKIFKKLTLALVGATLLSTIAVGCSNANSTSTDSDKKVTLKIALWGDDEYKYMSETNKIADAYKKEHPNVTLEIEKIAPKEYDNTMKIRSSAGQLPDVFPVRQANLSLYADIMVPLNELKATENNLYAKETMIKGNVIGLPEAVFNEFVFYNKNIFQEYNLEIPKTWDEFIKVCQTIKDGKKYTPLALGLKDSWVNYPLNEYMPMLEAGDGQYYNKMASKDDPFTKGEPFYNAYTKIQKLYDAKVSGDDPLGYGWDQQRAMFVAGKAGMLAAGSWYKSDYITNGGKEENLGVFLLPTRNTTSDPFYTTAMTEFFWGVPKTSKNQKEAKEFLEWFFGDYYTQLATTTNIKPTMKGVSYNDEFFAQAFEDVDAEPVTIFYDDNYNKVMNAMKFDVKGIGQQMVAGKNSLDSIMKDLNAQWKKARGN
ncbi:carbohydrate ABC transporter substrate-binding protein [Bacillus sp. FJAT-49705]|uniref:Carbohydrate ABC transporter substrate-binding protein n=1 Tax=Cytobacillus citreus TaxID=2833586 RepID=A0ABS5NW68_9BACI|nr:carbohydrate ABC transporter substrate-binding protein [Cytobacillus citreus]